MALDFEDKLHFLSTDFRAGKQFLESLLSISPVFFRLSLQTIVPTSSLARKDIEIMTKSEKGPFV